MGSVQSLLAWADIAYVMEGIHKKILLQRSTIDINDKLRVLDIPGEHTFMQSELISMLGSKLRSEESNG